MEIILHLAAAFIQRLADFLEPVSMPVVCDTPAPRDLDATFFDEQAQAHVGKVISGAIR